jgi:uncharacterized repeat protein (TIGR03803 family)
MTGRRGTASVRSTSVLVATLAIALIVPFGAQARGFDVLYSFAGGNDGAYPAASVVRDKAGNLYGTTQSGGFDNVGTVFKLTPAGVESVLHSFGTGYDGAYPTSSLIIDGTTNLYGTAGEGGVNNGGIVFKLTLDGTETILYSFGGGDGAGPAAGLVRRAGTLYGTTEFGGTNNDGVVFKLTKDGEESVLHSFSGGSDGGLPLAGLIMDGVGNLFGTTHFGGQDGSGTVFEIAPGDSEIVLHSFAGGSDGAYPDGALTLDASGNLYGTTSIGGASNSGTVFRIAADGTESVLYSFTGGKEGADPSCALVIDAASNLYGTTPLTETDGDGAVFRLAPDGTISVLHSFKGADGTNPEAGLIVDTKGRLYGTTPQGGAHGYGVVFRLRE